VPRLSTLPAAARLSAAGFVLLLFGFYAAAQANLWVRDGKGSLPGPDLVLWKYHGRPDSTKLHQVLDPSLDREHQKAMWPYLDAGADPAAIAERRAAIFAWLDQGAPRTGWAEVEATFTGYDTCGGCHVGGGRMQGLPFETYENVLVVARADEGMPWPSLLTSAHNHAFAFAVLALLLGLGVATTGLPRPLQVLSVLAAFAGAALDVGSWFLTKWLGAPWQYGVILGGGLFGAAVLLLAVALLDEAVWGGRLAALLARGRRAGG
jgi:hypothetical protein